jgi:tetratricopeptide (TPR) repeat protein
MYHDPMLKRLLPVLVLVVSIHPASVAGKLPKPDRISAPPTADQIALIREGVALHDQRNYEGAIAKYKQVLAQNPWEVKALYELGFSYFESKDYQGALETARLGAQCRSEGLIGFYLTIGNALDELGRGSEAIETYRAAIKLNPRAALLHYNLAVSLRRAGKQPEAKAAVEKALQCDPAHASSHMVLGAIYEQLGYRVPAILAYSRFLVLEPESPRSAQILPALQGLLTQGVGKGKKPNEITIFVSGTPKGRKDEGDFTGVELMMSVVLVADLITPPPGVEKAPESAHQKLSSQYTSMGEALDNSKAKKGFAAMYYAPYFAALTKEGYPEAFTAHAWRAGKVEGASDWAMANKAKIETFLEWSKAYQWPAK